MIQAIDFFCGCGGTSAGLRNAGIQILAGIDFDAEAGQTFQRNFPEAKFFYEDIRSLQPFDFENFIARERRSPLLFSACAPCQPFSKQKTTRRNEDDRITLLDELHRFVRVFRPEYIFLENVPGLQKSKTNAGPLARFVRLLESLGYCVDIQLPESRGYGVPQVRKRLVLVATTIASLTVPPPTHGPGTPNEKYESVWDWIGDLPEILAGEEHQEIPNHRAAALSEINKKRISCTPEGGSRLDWPDALKLKCHKNHTGHTDVYGRLHKERPSAALSTRCISLSNGRFGHPTQNRAISAREAARLQTFSDNFIFEGSLNSTARQIGNAVPVRLAEVFGKHFKNHFNSSSIFQDAI